MKIFATVLFAGLIMAFASSDSELKLGDEAPNTTYEMLDVSGKKVSLESLKKKNGVAVIFSCNTCPFVLGWEDQYPVMAKAAKDAEIGIVLVNSNEAKRDGDDSFEEMKEHAKKANYTMPYVVDQDAFLANSFGANTTPHVYLFDAHMKLVYTGSINDKYEQKSKVATTRWFYDAMMDVANGGTIDPAVTKNIGCSIKRK